MKVCIPTESNFGLDDHLSQHFGRAQTFTVVDMETGKVKVIRNDSSHMGGSKLPPEILAEHGVDVMIVGGLGPKAITMFESFGIKVVVGGSGLVRDVIEDWKAGNLRKATIDDGCLEHRH